MTTEEKTPERVVPKIRREEWGALGEPAFAIVAGDSGSGKTTDMGLSLAGIALFAAQEGGLKPVWTVGRVDLDATKQRRTIHYVEEATALARWIGKNPNRGIEALGVDDLSLLMLNSYRRIAKEDPPMVQSKKTGVWEINMLEVWDRVGDRVIEFGQEARWAGCHVVAGTHLRPAENIKDRQTGEMVFTKGGPELPSRKLTRRLPHLADVVYCAEARCPKPWRSVYICREGDADIYMKDRLDVVRGEAPMNIGEILRHAGYTIRRPKGLEWMEKVAETVATEILSGKPQAKVCAEIAHRIYYKRPGMLRQHVYWAIHRDGVDRALLRLAEQNRLFDLGVGASADSGPNEIKEEADGLL